MSLRVRIFLVFMLAIAIAVFALLSWMNTQMQPRYLEAQEDLMVDLAYSLANLVSREAILDGPDGVQIDADRLQALLGELDKLPVDATIYELHKQQVDVRIYVADAQGIVVFDSDRHRDIGVDYLHWRDVRLTLEGTYGARTSSKDRLFPEGSVMYVGAPLTHAGDIVGVLSVGKPTRNAERFLSAAISRFSEAAVVGALVLMLILLVLYRWLSLPMQRLVEYAHALQADQRPAPLKLGDHELGRVAQAMAELRSALDGKQQIEEYVQTLTHEIKSPAAAIRAAAELLTEDMPATERKRFLANIRAESARMLDLVHRVLELASLEARDRLIATVAMPLDELVGAAVEAVTPLSKAKQVEIVCTPCLALEVQGDRFLLQQALVNLLANAIDFSPIGGTITLTLHAKADGSVVVEVCDEGPGVPDYARERIFERFYGLPRPDGRKGTGLGLAFVRQVASLHGGTIQYRPRVGGGSCFELCLHV